MKTCFDMQNEMNTLDTKKKSDADVQYKFWTIKSHFFNK